MDKALDRSPSNSHSDSLSNSGSIGVFDSGLGGLTVLSAIQEKLPSENLVYFGDTARVPYGSKSKETIIRYSEEILSFLEGKNVKCIVVACNTASSHALEHLREKSALPILGVVEPGAKALVEQFPDVKHAAVIATRSTIKSGAYEKEIKKLNAGIKLYSRDCPLFVPLIEEGFSNKKVAELIIRDYMDEVARENISHVILGCTHYPLLKDSIVNVYPDIQLIDSSTETARVLESSLLENSLTNTSKERGKIQLYVSDITDSLLDMEKLFFGNTIDKVEKIQLGW